MWGKEAAGNQYQISSTETLRYIINNLTIPLIFQIFAR